MKILPANSEGCWIFIFVIFLSFFCHLICHFFVIPVLWSHFLVIFLSFFCHFLVILFVIFLLFFWHLFVIFLAFSLLSGTVFHVFCRFPPSEQFGGCCPTHVFSSSMFEFFCLRACCLHGSLLSILLTSVQMFLLSFAVLSSFHALLSPVVFCVALLCLYVYLLMMVMSVFIRVVFCLFILLLFCFGLVGLEISLTVVMECQG